MHQPLNIKYPNVTSDIESESVETTGKTPRQKMLNGLAVFSTGYIKRLLEHSYDDIFQTELGKRLIALDPKAKYAFEAGLYALMAYADQSITDSSPLKILIKELGKDVPSEICSRLLDGVKEQIQTDGDKADNPSDRKLAQALLTLDNTTLLELLRWSSTMEENKRADLLEMLRTFTADELKKFAGLPPEQRIALLDLCKSVLKKGGT